MDETADALEYQKEIDALFAEQQPDLDDVRAAPRAATVPLTCVLPAG
jgi:hypothetical protein